MDDNLLSKIPNMNSILDHAGFKDMERERVKQAALIFIDRLREDIHTGIIDEVPSPDECAAQVLKILTKEKSLNLRGVINATGIILHTNLGRAPIGESVLTEINGVLRGYSNLEYDLETGRRGSRYAHVESIVCELTGAPAAMVVNNNAAAIFLALAAIAKGKRVAVSRGELVEIGGSFRVPEIMESSGAELVEVGTTNKTRLRDYAAAVSERGAEILLKVHTSNYQIVGFTESVSISELSSFGVSHGTPVIYDMGSCFMVEPGLLGFETGETAAGAIMAGADLICFSGDKLLGASQAGIIAGKARCIELMKQSPLARMVRPDKTTLSILEATLRLYSYPKEAIRKIPALSMLAVSSQELRQRAETLAQRIKQTCSGWDVGICEIEDEVGGGALPGVRLQGWGVELRPCGMSINRLEQCLRNSRKPVIARLHEGKTLISPRTLLPGEDDELLEALRVIAIS